MKKLFIAVSMFLLFFFISCSGFKSFTIVKNNVPSSSKYGKTNMYAGVLNKNHLDQFKAMGRQSTVEDNRLTTKQKRQQMNEFESLKFEKNRFFSFTMAYNQPFLDDELNFKFKIVDNRRKDQFQSFSLIPIKTTFISQYGSRNSYNYTFVLKTKRALKKNKKYKLYVRLPDKKTQIYQVDLL